MKNIEEQTYSAFLLENKSVSAFLRENPDFFIRNARQVEQMTVQHPERGNISLVEWHMARQCNHIQQLEEEITLLMEQATANHQLFDRLLLLQSHLAADSLQEILTRLHRWARKLGMAGANVRLFSDQWHIGAPSNFTQLGLSRQAFEPLRIQRFRQEQHHYLGSLNGPESLLLPQGKAIGSVVMSLMGERGDLGVLIFSSHDNQHYQAGMGTLLLHLAQMLPNLLVRWVERA